MQLGVGFLPWMTSEARNASARYDKFLRLACLADEMGFEHVQVSGIPLSVDDGDGPDHVPLFGAMSSLRLSPQDLLVNLSVWAFSLSSPQYVVRENICIE